MTILSQTQNVVVANAGTASEAFHVGDAERGSILIPAALSGTALDFQVSMEGTTWDVLRDTDDSDLAAKVVAINKLYILPSQLFNYKFARLVVDAQGGERTFVIYLAGPG